jgi:hypothetical protein
MLAHTHIDNSLTCSRFIALSLSARAGGRLELYLNFDNYMLAPLSTTPLLNSHPSTRSIHRRYPFASHRLSVVNYKILCPFSKTTKEGSYHGPARHSLESLCRPAADEAPLGILIRSVSSYLDDAKCNFAIHATKEIEKAGVHNQSTVPRSLFIHTACLSDFVCRA